MRVLSALCLLLLLPSVGAQGIFPTDILVAAPANSTVVYEATDAAPPADAQKVYLATSTLAASFTTQWDYFVSEAFVASGALSLTFYISCDLETVMRPGVDNPANPVATARGLLAKDGTVLGQANLFSIRTCDGPDDVWEAVFQVDGADTAFAPGNVLNLQLIIWGPNGAPGTGLENFFIYAGGAYPSGLTGASLPGGAIVVAGPEIVHGNLTGPEATIEHDWATSRNTIFAYNWTAPEGNVSVDLAVAPAQGNVTVTILDAAGTELHNATFGAATNETLSLAGGNWTLRVAYDDFVGTFRLFADAMPEMVPVTPPPVGNETTPPPADNNGTATDNGAPGLPVVLLMAAMAGVAVRRRRN